MGELLGFLSSEHAISLGGWVISLFLFVWVIKLMRDQYSKALELAKDMSLLVSNNTEAITKLSIMLDERTRYIRKD